MPFAFEEALFLADPEDKEKRLYGEAKEIEAKYRVLRKRADAITDVVAKKAFLAKEVEPVMTEGKFIVTRLEEHRKKVSSTLDFVEVNSKLSCCFSAWTQGPGGELRSSCSCGEEYGGGDDDDEGDWSVDVEASPGASGYKACEY